MESLLTVYNVCVYIWQMSYHIFVACAFIIINVHFNNCSLTRHRHHGGWRPRCKGVVS